MKKKRYLALGVGLIAAAAIGLTGAGYAHEATDSQEQSASQAHYRGERGDRDEEHFRGAQDGWRESHDRHGSEDGLEYAEAEDGDDESHDRRGRTTSTDAPNTPNTPNIPTPPTTAAPTTTTTAVIDAAALYAQSCSSCHGNPATESRFANRTQAQIEAALTSGVMSSYARSMSAAQITALASYVANGGN